MPPMSSEVTPRVSVQPDSVRPGPEPGAVEVHWRLENLSDEPVSVLETWLPHGQFFAPRESLGPPLTLPAHERRTIRRHVRIPSDPSIVVENAFLNLRVSYQGRPWRVLARMRAEHQAPDSVSVKVEAISAHRVGFAEAPAEEQR
jgi:hypothetical protein